MARLFFFTRTIGVFAADLSTSLISVLYIFEFLFDFFGCAGTPLLVIEFQVSNGSFRHSWTANPSGYLVYTSLVWSSRHPNHGVKVVVETEPKVTNFCSPVLLQLTEEFRDFCPSSL